MRRLGAKAPVELLDPDEDGAHVRDRIDAEVGTRAVRGAALCLDLEADEALVRDRETQLGRLGDDRRVCGVALGDARRADARHLLVADGRHDHVSGEAGPAPPRPRRA